MNLKRTNLSIESIIDNRDLRIRLQHIKTFYVKRLKAITAACFVLIIVLLVTIFQLNGRARAQAAENSRLSAQLNILRSQMSDREAKLNLVTSEKDSTSNKALTYIESIQAKLGKINTYLRKRGLRSISFKTNKAARKDNDESSYVQLYSRYNRYLDQLVTDIEKMPMGYPRVSSFTSFFGYRSNPFNDDRNEFHPGLDFKGKTGDPVKCTASGTVVFTGRAGGYGNCIRIRHGNKLETLYGHLSRILVKRGQKVNVGQLIGRVGSTGRSTGPHLHYEVRRNGKAVNPKQYLSLN